MGLAVDPKTFNVRGRVEIVSYPERLIARMDDATQSLETIRKRIEHEDDLLNQRVSWIVSSQAFLLTGYAILLNAPTNELHRPTIAAAMPARNEIWPIWRTATR